jgi:oxygen-independent coproporphyrinogen-3 oxidase
MGPYLGRILGDIVEWGGLLGRAELDTLYVGGGTPSLLSVEHLEAIGKTIMDGFDTGGVLESTLEVNPGTLDPAWLGAARRLGWDRISLGVQTLDDGALSMLGRAHVAAQGLASIRSCKDAGFRRLSADLLLGAPGQKSSRVLDDAGRLIDAGVEHLSVYMLDLDKPCRMKAMSDAGQLDLPSEEEVADAYQALQEFLPSLGLVQYEISNFSLPGRHSVHNVRYWQRRPYIGIGPGAAGHIGNLRWGECESVADWVGGAREADMQRLDPREALAEIPLLGLRMQEGVDWAAVRDSAELLGLAWQVDQWEAELAPLAAGGLVKRNENMLCLTPKGMLLGNRVFQVFVT